jgi:hypothetical protein
VADFQFSEEFLLLQLNAIFSLAAKIVVTHLEAPETTTFTKVRALGRILSQ